MADVKLPTITELNETPASGDLFHIVDVSDTTDDATGSSKKITRANVIPTNAETKTAYEANADTNAFTDAEKSKLSGIAASANNYVHPNHSGDVTSVGDGAQTIANDAVSNAKLANVATSTIKGRVTAGTGDPEDLSATQVRTLINVADGANNYTHPNHSGDVTSSGDGATTIANKQTLSATSPVNVSNTPTVIASSAPVITVDDATTTAKGVSELATAAETTTGTDNTRVITPDALAGSNFGKRVVALGIVESDTAVAVADGKVGIPITAELNGFEVVGAQANVYAKGVTGTTDIQIRRQRGASDVDVLSTKITIGDEYFATDGVINTSNDDLATGDMLFVDVDTVHSGTPPEGLSVAIVMQLP